MLFRINAIKRYRSVLAAVVAAALIFAAAHGFVAQARLERMQSAVEVLSKEKEQAFKERNWIQFFYRQYGAAMQYQDYGRVDPDLYAVYAGEEKNFLDISDIYQHRVCPAQVKGLVGQSYLYYGARLLVLPQDSSLPHVYVMSYLGNATWTHNNLAFDTYISQEFLRDAQIDVGQDAGLVKSWLSRHDKKAFLAGPSEFYRPLSYNSGDVDRDGRDDFILGGELVLAKLFEKASGHFNAGTAAVEVPGESIFLPDGGVLSLVGESLVMQRWDGNSLRPQWQQQLEAAPADDVPFRLLPFLEGSVALRMKDGLQLIKEESGQWVKAGMITGLQDGEVLVGGHGDFNSDGSSDLWVVQPRWKSKEGKIVGRLWLIDGTGVLDGSIDALARARITGSTRYTNYDGIGSTLSQKAGDVDGDGKPDISFSGHRHMNEAGALFVLSGSEIKPDMSVEDAAVVKIKGRPVSQLAPPFNHWDAADYNADGYDDILVAADNDMCAGLNAGALYIIDGKRMLDAWKSRRR